MGRRVGWNARRLRRRIVYSIDGWQLVVRFVFRKLFVRRIVLGRQHVHSGNRHTFVRLGGHGHQRQLTEGPMKYFNFRGHIVPLALLATPAAALAAPAANSAYMTDAQSSYVQDATSQSIGQVNMIACVMHSMRPDALVNQGPYIALVDKNACDASKSSLAASGSSSGASQAPDYMNAVVDSTRTSNSDPMLVKAWISMNQDGTPVTIYAHISATEAPSTSNPYGAFRLDYCGKADGGSGGCLMNGFMQGGSGTLSYYEVDNNQGGSETTALQLSSVGTTTGSGSLNVVEPGNGTSAYNFAYDASYFLRDDGVSGAQCFNRDASDPQTGLSVWEYGLYDSTTGARVDRNSGFPIQFVSGGTTYQGYLGYFGMSLPAQATITSGATVQKVDYSSGNSPSTTNYTVVINPGRLTRYTKKARTLKDIDQIHFNAFINAVGSSGLPAANTQYDMYWDDATGKFIATGEMLCGPNGCQTSPITAVSVDSSFFATYGLQGWSQSLGGDLFVVLTGVSGSVDSTTSGNVAVIYHVQDIVYPDDPNKPTQLYCVAQCPTATTMNAYFTQTPGSNTVQSPFVAATANNMPVNLASVVLYSVDANAQLVGGDGSASPAAFTSDASAFQQFSQFQNGVMSGKLFTDESFASCNSNQFCDWSVNSNADVYYQWQTGPNTWNQFSAVKDSSGNFVHFDAPLDVTFKVPSGAQYGTYANTSLILQYNSFGNLSGIPGSCVSATTNLPVNCGSQDSRYVPQFVIPYDPTANPQQGVVTTSANGVTTTYLVKWLQREIRFAQKNPSVCQADGLSAPTNVQLPTQSQLKDPSNSSSTDVYLGAKPTVTSAPRVVQGDVKY